MFIHIYLYLIWQKKYTNNIANKHFAVHKKLRDIYIKIIKLNKTL